MAEALEGADDLAKRLRALSEKTPRIILEAWQADTVARAKDNVAPFSKTRTLSRSIRAGDLDVRSGNATVLAGGTSTIGYARFVEEGTRPHIIRPKNKKSLFFPSQGALTARAGAGATIGFRRSGNVNAATMRRFGNLAFVHAKVVRHPGTRAQPYLRPAASDAMRALDLGPAVRVAWDGAA